MQIRRWIDTTYIECLCYKNMFGKTEIQAGNLKRQSKHMKGIAQWAGMGGYVSEGKRLSILIQCFLWFEKLTR